MNKRGLFGLLVIFGIAAVIVVPSLRESKRYALTMLSYNIGKELIETTNSSLLTIVDPALRAQLTQILGSTTHIASVHLGDEAAPVGDGRASSRIILTNAQSQGLEIRLRSVVDATHETRFEVLSFWRLGEPGAVTK